VSLSSLHSTQELEITGILLSPRSDPATLPHAEDWWTPLLMSISPACCARLQSVLLCFGLPYRSQLDQVSWDKLERALSPARCHRLRTLHVRFFPAIHAISEGEMRERLPVLASGDVVNLVVSNSSHSLIF
jgi:hypothetical protein